MTTPKRKSVKDLTLSEAATRLKDIQAEAEEIRQYFQAIAGPLNQTLQTLNPRPVATYQEQVAAPSAAPGQALDYTPATPLYDPE